MTSPESTHKQCEAEFVTTVVSDITEVDKDIRVFTLKPEQTYAFKAGQYANISFNDMAPRPYSIASRPMIDNIEIHIKRGCSDVSRHIMDEVKTGDQASISLPRGRSIYDRAENESILAIAGGLGIAPMKSIVDEAIQRGHTQPIALFWGVTREEELYLKSYFEELTKLYENFTFFPITGGAVTDAAINACTDLSETHVFVSGSPAMISHAIPLLLDKNADRSKISYDQHPEAGNLKA